MDPKRWQQLQKLFEEALALPADQRERVLESCTDPELRRKVEAMLAAADREGPLTAVIHGELRELARGAPAPHIAGQQVGAYRLRREIGRGGMGIVFEAERADGEFEHRVALKLMRGSLLTPGRRERFQAERQILASLEHPNIARLLDGGTTEDGTPYLVMEHVRGEAIDEHCDRLSLTVEERLLLFRRVCTAVEAAHRSLVVHRDLKPSNILVTADGEPKLLDFGVAKLIEPARHSEEDTLTVEGERVMTPDYASPEQVRAQPVSTATDVYALGLLLYELLTGRRAQRLSSTDRAEVERIICDTPPARPSSSVTSELTSEIALLRSTTPARLEHRLAGDLDTIVLTALRKEPDRRYASVTQFSEDVGRHLDGWPILAQADSWRYRAGKFVRRNRTTVAAASIAVVSLIAASAASTWGLLRAREAEAEAVRQASTAEEITGFLERLFSVSDPSEARGNSVTAREILDLGVERIDSELAEQPTVQGRLLTTMGRVYYGLGLYEQAHRMFESAHGVLRNSLGAEHPETLRALGSLGNTFEDLGRPDEAEARLREAYETARRSLGEEHVDTLKYLGNLALMVWRQGRIDEAVELNRRTFELRRRVLGEDHLHTVVAASNLADALNAAGRVPEAASLAEACVEQFTSHFGRDHPYTLDTMNNLSRMYSELGRYDRQEELLEELLEHWNRLFDEDHPRRLNARCNLALARTRVEANEEQLATLLSIFERRQELLGPDHFDTLMSEWSVGVIYARMGRTAEAEPWLESALEGSERVQGPAHHDTLRALADLARLYVPQDRLEEAEARFRQLLTAWHSVDERHPSTLQAMSELGGVLSARGRSEEASALLTDAVDRLREIHPDHSLLLAESLIRLARHRMGAGDLATAEPLLVEARRQVEHLHPATHRAPDEALAELRRLQVHPSSRPRATPAPS